MRFSCFSSKVTFMCIEKFDEVCNHISAATQLIAIEQSNHWYCKISFRRRFKICQKLKNILHLFSFKFHLCRLPNPINLITIHGKVNCESMRFICQFNPLAPNVAFLYLLIMCFQRITFIRNRLGQMLHLYWKLSVDLHYVFIAWFLY